MVLPSVTSVKSSTLAVRHVFLEDAWSASNTLNFFFKNSSRDQWNYICNFLHNLFRLHFKTKQYFWDVSAPIRSNIRDSCFIVLSEVVKNRTSRKIYIYYLLTNRKYKFYYDPI